METFDNPSLRYHWTIFVGFDKVSCFYFYAWLGYWKTISMPFTQLLWRCKHKGIISKNRVFISFVFDDVLSLTHLLTFRCSLSSIKSQVERISFQGFLMPANTHMGHMDFKSFQVYLFRKPSKLDWLAIVFHY